MLDKLIEQYGRRLFGLCLTLCAHRQDAEDLYQDTWLKVLNYLDRYDPAKEFEPWLTTICVNTYRDRLRRFLRTPLFHSLDGREDLAVPEETDYRDLHGAIDRLPEALRLTVILYYFQGYDLQAVSKILNIPVGTVKSRLSRARKQLKEVLCHEDDLQF